MLVVFFGAMRWDELTDVSEGLVGWSRWVREGCEEGRTKVVGLG